jgi:hypothetical protein
MIVSAAPLKYLDEKNDLEVFSDELGHDGGGVLFNEFIIFSRFAKRIKKALSSESKFALSIILESQSFTGHWGLISDFENLLRSNFSFPVLSLIENQKVEQTVLNQIEATIVALALLHKKKKKLIINEN